MEEAVLDGTVRHGGGVVMLAVGATLLAVLALVGLLVVLARMERRRNDSVADFQRRHPWAGRSGKGKGRPWAL